MGEDGAQHRHTEEQKGEGREVICSRAKKGMASQRHALASHRALCSPLTLSSSPLSIASWEESECRCGLGYGERREIWREGRTDHLHVIEREPEHPLRGIELLGIHDVSDGSHDGHKGTRIICAAAAGQSKVR